MAEEEFVIGPFVGTWLLDSFESVAADGAKTLPWGDHPLGIISWDAAGNFAVQVGPRESERSAEYVAFFGKAAGHVSDPAKIVLRVVGSSAPGRVNGDQVRSYFFLEPGLLRMRPPAAANGSQSTFIWRRA